MGGTSSSLRLRTAFSLRRDGGVSRKILVLGCMGAGKSTLCRILAKAANAPAPPSRLYKHTIENNLLEAFKALFELARRYGISTDKFRNDLDILLDFRHREDLHANAVEAMKRLSRTTIYVEVTQKDRTRILELPYNINYFMQNSDRILSRTFDPTEADVMSCYAQTVGTNFQSVRLGPARYELLELPGHHIFRRSWREFFADTNVVIFVIDLSDLLRPQFYNGGHLQDKVRMVLRSIVTHQALKDTPFILLFNKRDLLEECGAGFYFQQLGPSIRTWENAEKWYIDQCTTVIPPTNRVYTHSLALTKKPDLNTTILDTLSQIFKANQNSMEAE